MQLSLSNWVFSKLPLEQSIGKVSELGFTNMEFNPKCIEYEAEESVHDVKKLIEIYRLRCLSVHCASLYVDKNSQLPEALRYGKASINLASILSSPLLVVHSYISKDLDRKTRRGFLEKIFGELKDYSTGKNVKLALENIRPTSKGFGCTVDELEEILDVIGREDIYITFDLCHAQAAGQTLIFLEKFRKKIINVHLSSHSHKALEFTSDLKILLNTLKQDGYVGPLTIEINPSYGEGEVVKAKLILERMLERL